MTQVVTADKMETKTDKEKVVEKRRALGRGLESLLPGPRVVKPAPAPRADAAPATSPAASSSSPSLVSPSSPSVAASPATSPTPGAHTSSEREPPAPVTPSAVVNLHGTAAAGEEVVRLPVAQVDGNPYQTRRVFDEKPLMDLAQSIRVQGVLQPIVVRPGKDGYFILILGERRLRAARLAGMEEIPAIVKRVSDQQAAEMTVVENLQRQDLNCVDQAEAFANLSTKFQLTQEQIGARVGLSREAVSNYMRILTLSDNIIGALQKGTLTFSHARALLMVPDTAERWTIAQKVIEEKMSVAKLEDLVHELALPKATRGAKDGSGARWLDPNVKAAQRSLEEVLGMRVNIRDRQGKGKIVIAYDTIDDFDRVVRMLKGK